MPSILICVPTYAKMDAPFVQSVLSLERPCTCGIQFITDTLIAEARNRFAKEAIEGGYDYVFFMDSDMTFPTDALVKLYEDNVDVVSGLYFKRRPNYSPIMYPTLRIEDDKFVFESYLDDYPEDQMVEVEGVGGGCLLIKTSVLEAVQNRFGGPFDQLGGIGEDFSFCLRARECGYKIFCDTRVVCGHQGTIIVDDKNRKSLQKIAENS